MHRPARLGLLILAVVSAGCRGPALDLTQTLQVTDLSTGWYDVGIVDGQNKLVPSVSFALKNGSDQTLSVLQVNVIFRRVNEPEEWGSSWLPVTGSEGLPPGEMSKILTARSQQGYKGTEPRADMLQNAYFVDAKAELFAKYGSVQWQKLGDYPINRQLIAR
jgi:hypothetical protein